MPRKRARQGTDTAVLDYRHDSARKHIPPAGLAAQGKVHEAPRRQFAYDPHLPPVLRSDPTGGLMKKKFIQPLQIDSIFVPFYQRK